MSTILKPQSYTQANVNQCISCEKSINSESLQKGIPRTKCDACKKDTDRLVNRIRYWERKVLSSSRKIKTHCIHGHEFTPQNSVYRKDGIRLCRTCKNIRNLIYQKNTNQALQYYYSHKKSPNFRIKVSQEEFDKIKNIIQRPWWKS